MIKLFPSTGWSREDQVPHSRRIWAPSPVTLVTPTDHSVTLRYLGNQLIKKLQLTTVRFSTNKHHPEILISTVGAEDAAVNTSVATVYLAKRSASWKAVAIATTELRALIFLGFGRWFSCSAAQPPGGGAQALLVYVNGCTGLMLNTRLEVCWVQWT